METTALTILEKIGECLAAPVGRQFGYLFHLNSNIKTLIDEAEKLKIIRDSIDMCVQAALNNVENIEPIVDKWLVNSHKVVEEADIIIQGKVELPEGCFRQWCLNLKLRYALSRNAKKKTEVVMKLIQEGQFRNISCPASLIPFLASSSTTRNFDTRKSILEEIIRTLMDDKINMIGICGMGGVGKTTVAGEIRKRVVEEKLFDDCAMAVISQKQDFAKIQSDIAEMLGLKLYEQNPIARKDKLHQRLEKGRVLVILDDVWAQFDLNVLGITFTKGCKVLFTSRVQNLWWELETKIDIDLDVLEESEAWDLFEAKVGDSLKNEPKLRPVAKEIVKECGGLPLALMTIGSALVRKGIHTWRHTRDRLKSGCPSKVPGIPAEVYQSIKLSYDYLEEEKNTIFFGDCEEMKSLFLLCCLFEEDFDIPVDDLVKMGQGLRLFIGANGLEQARDRVFALLEQLKSRYLLLPGRETYDVDRKINSNEHVRMHDVVRDVAKSIAAEEKGALILDNGTRETVWQEHVMGKNFTWISIISEEIRELPIELRSSQIKLLKCTNDVLQITDNFFENMEELLVLDLYGMKDRKLPSLLRLPSSLRTLYLRESDLRNTTIGGDLRNLESLDLGRSEIKEWPIELVCSSNLVSVDLRRCQSTYNALFRIPAGIISRLGRLKELYVEDIKIDWEGGENEEGRNANIREFESLTNLHTLHIWIKDASILPTSPLFSNLKKYKIQIGGYSPYIQTYEKCCSISLPTFVPLKGDIKFFLKNSEELYLDGEYTKDLVHELVQDGCQSLKCLRFQRINTLEQISRGPLMLGSFGKLKELRVHHCNKLRNVFQLSIVTELVFLETLSIGNCESMEEVIWGDREDNATKKLAFPKLETLIINSLPRLISFCRGIDDIEFPQLKSLILSNLPQLVTPFRRMPNQSIFAPKVSFPALENLELGYLGNMKEVLCGQYFQGESFLNLTQIDVYDCNKIRGVLNHFMAIYLVHLQELNICRCSLLEVVVAKEEEGDGQENTNFLPALKSVHLEDLPTLESFCDVAHELEFMMLSDIGIENCPEMNTFSPAPVSTPKLNNVKLDYIGKRTLWVEDLNTTIMHLHQQKMQKGN